jgi:flagellar hook-associated protein 3 FlgL
MQIQADMSKVSTEVSTQKIADVGLTLGAHTGTALSLQSEVDRLTSYQNTNALATSRLASTSSALTTMLSSAQNISQSLTEATGVGGSATLQTGGQDALNSLIGMLNTSTAGQFIFSGINTDKTAITPYTSTSPAKASVDSAFQTAFGVSQTSDAASSITGTQMQSFLDTQFSALFDDSHWQSNWSAASSQTIQTAVSPSQSISTSVSANDSSIRNVAQAYTMLSEFTGQNLSSGARAAVIATASKLMDSGVSGLTNLEAGVGVAQATLDDTGTQINSQLEVINNNITSLEGVDTAALSTKVSALQTQLTASYELTSRIAQLSLVNYLTS